VAGSATVARLAGIELISGSMATLALLLGDLKENEVAFRCDTPALLRSDLSDVGDGGLSEKLTLLSPPFRGES
jgi:hypothetical protein